MMNWNFDLAQKGMTRFLQQKSLGVKKRERRAGRIFFPPSSFDVITLSSPFAWKDKHQPNCSFKLNQLIIFWGFFSSFSLFPPSLSDSLIFRSIQRKQCNVFLKILSERNVERETLRFLNVLKRETLRKRRVMNVWS